MDGKTWLDVVDEALEELRISAPVQYTEEVEGAQAVVQYVLAKMLEPDWLLSPCVNLAAEEAA